MIRPTTPPSMAVVFDRDGRPDKLVHLSIAPADPAADRWDVVIMRDYRHPWGGRHVFVEVVQGMPGEPPTRTATMPAALVWVRPGATAITAEDIIRG